MPEISLQGYTVIIDEDILQLYIFKQMAKVGINSLQALAGRNYPVYSEIAGQMLGRISQRHTAALQTGCGGISGVIPDGTGMGQGCPRCWQDEGGVSVAN